MPYPLLTSFFFLIIGCVIVACDVIPPSVVLEMSSTIGVRGFFCPGGSTGTFNDMIACDDFFCCADSTLLIALRELLHATTLLLRVRGAPWWWDDSRESKDDLEP